MKFKLMTDSTSQIPPEFAEEKKIAIIEPTIDFEGKHCKDISDLDRNYFFSKLKKMNPVPKTSVANPQNVLEVLEQIKKDGQDEVLYVHLTQAMSNQLGTVQIAAKKMKNDLKVHYYNTEFSATAEGPFVLYAQKLKEEGKSIDEITKTLDKMKPLIYSMGISSSFNVLFRTGRIKKSVKMTMISSMMNLKPIFESTRDKGYGSGGAGTGYGSAVKKIIASLEEKTDANVEYNLIVNHIANPKLAKKLEEGVKSIRKIKDVQYWEISPVVANTLGYGTASISLYPTFETITK
ncbi:MAG: DegV family EDD domain-containing protein [Candidatus Heimdallarchaeota archaeon]|nr:DegV family EDD domain-containing protein [Candidatus Heimdallarchaeota archaeon]MCK5143983.1 DegV family EDD domain-containing protein [Candidatus Heimdallarchaeota archaeon]